MPALPLLPSPSVRRLNLYPHLHQTLLHAERQHPTIYYPPLPSCPPSIYTLELTNRPSFLDAYTLNVVGQDEFEDVKVPEKK